MLSWRADHPMTKTLSRAFGLAGVYPVSLTRAMVYRAMKEDDVTEMLHLVKRCPAALNAADEGRLPSFLVAVVQGYRNCIEAMARHYPQLLTDTDGQGRNILLQGMELWNFNENHAELLIRLGADPNARDAKGDTPLHYAARSFINQIDFTGKLLDHHAEIDARNDAGDTPLIVAAQRNDSDLVNFLLLRNADMDAADDSGVTAVMHAIRRHNFGAAVYLLAYGAKLELDDEDVETALRVATMEMHTDFLKLIGARQGERDRVRSAQLEQEVSAIASGTQAPVTAMKPLRLKSQ
jgi:uncharacterized protein